MNVRKKCSANTLIILVLLVLASIGERAAAEPAQESKIVTFADDGQTISLKANETFLLKLGEEYDWNIAIDDQTIVSRDVLVVSGAQGLYRAHKEGSSTFSTSLKNLSKSLSSQTLHSNSHFQLPSDPFFNK